MDQRKDFLEAMLGIATFGGMLIMGVFGSIALSMRAEAGFGPDAGFMAGAATLLVCWGTAFFVLYRVFKEAASGPRIPRKS